ncbi:recombinase-like helix-turn-helix domain-containing protein [Streptomyces sp. NPDC050418]|uniref:recombinase-like helix-turn-helix domain-containing protein n=1 Tax=Streptomyces sp. NPDC050418 TaxID=3365612 RepID=UPI0037A18DAF
MTTNVTSETWPSLDRHQSRDHEPTPYELKLARTLEEIFSTEGHDLADVIAGLNARQVATFDGSPWTEESFRAEMRRLGA